MVKLGSILLILFGVAGCSSGGLGLFEKKPETTPADLRVEQIQDQDGKKTVITGTNDANAKEGMNIKIGPDGEIDANSGGSRKLEKWSDSDTAAVRSWGWVFLFGGLGVLAIRQTIWPLAPLTLVYTCVGIGIFNLTVGPAIIQAMAGFTWNIICLAVCVKVALSGGFANIRGSVLKTKEALAKAVA